MGGRQQRRKVLLAIRPGSPDRRLLASAQGLCQRLDADQDILARAHEDQPLDGLESFMAGLRDAGIGYRLMFQPGIRRRDIVEYANARECIAALVIDSLHGWEQVAEDRGADPWRRLACPLVSAIPLDSGADAALAP